MLNYFVQKFNSVDRDVSAISYFLLILIILLLSRALILIYHLRLNELWAILAPLASLVAALLVERVATRLIINNNIIEENNRRKEIVRVTHQLLAVIQDLLSRVVYFKQLLGEANRPVLALYELASTIEHRYEKLLNKTEIYQYLQGQSVDLIINMSGSIFGISILGLAIAKTTTDKPLVSSFSILPPAKEQSIAQLDILIGDLNKLIDQIYELRNSIDQNQVK